MSLFQTLFRRQMSSSKLLALLTLYFTLVLNYAFYKTVLALHPNFDLFDHDAICNVFYFICGLPNFSLALPA